MEETAVPAQTFGPGRETNGSLEKQEWRDG